MKCFFKVVAVLVASAFVTGCGFNLYPAANLNLAQTEVVLQSNNFRVVGEASGEASATYILGIGGLSTKAIYANAVAEMYNNARLAGSQTIVNINVHQHSGGVPPLFMKMRYVATGQIVEFTK